MMEKQHKSAALLDENIQEKYWEKKLCFISKDVSSKQKSELSNNFSKEKPAIHHLQPSSLLTRVKSFLPEIDAANKALSKTSHEERNIENVQNCSKIIEMDIAFVEDLQQTALSNFLDSLSSDSSDSESDSDSKTVCFKADSSVG